ncbi:MAG: GAF domain-containing protein [Anaerolineales bacterium]|nr:GAF domain-containing protein [Anaerolineales bacterium]
MKYRIEKILLFIILAITLSACVANTPPTSTESQTPPAPLLPSQPASPNFNRSIRFEHISLEQGLSQSVINVIFQDSKGFLWIGTEDGLNRYDGYSFKVFKPEAENETSLSNRWITSIVEDQDGYIWIGTRQGGLNRFDPRSGLFTVFKHDPNDKNSLSNNRINALYMSENNTLWVGTDSDLDRFNSADETFVHYLGDEDGLENPITALYQDLKGFLWIGVRSNGLYQLDEESNSIKAFTTSNNINTLSDNNITSITEDLDENLWVATQNGLNRFKANTETFARYIHKPETPESISSDALNNLFMDHNGVLWIATNDGLDIYNAQLDQFIHYRHEPSNPGSVSNNLILSIFEDRGNVMWIGTNGGGLNKYNRRQDEFAYYRGDLSNTNSLSGNLISAVFVEPKGTVWVGTLDSGLNRFSPATGEFKQFHHDPSNPNSLSSDQIYSILVDRHGTLWVGTSNALNLFDPNTGVSRRFEPLDDENSLSGVPVYAIYEDRRGNIWLGTNEGLDQFNPVTETFTNYRYESQNPNSLSDSQVVAIKEDLQGDLWVGTMDGGLNRFEYGGGNFIRYQNRRGDPKSLSNDTILSIYESKNGTLWVGTAGGGLNRYDFKTDSFTSFTEKDGLPNNVINGILEDPENNLWLSTNYGLSRFNPFTLEFRNYTVSDGLQSNEFNSNAHAITPHGEMYFGGINGINFFDPLSITTDNYVPPIVLTSLTQNGEPMTTEVRVEALEEITLQWPNNSFEFEFAALSYSQPNKNQYAYLLENFDEGWNYIGAKHSSRYTNLPGGTYTLKLRGSNSDGTWNNQGHSIRITVIPPVWETWWFRGLFILTFGTVVAAGYRWRVKTIESRNRQLENLVQRRTSDLEKRTRDIEALYEADERIIRNVTLNQVFQTLVDVSVSVLKADRSVVFVWNEEKKKILPYISRGFQPETLYALNFDDGEGMAGKAMMTGEAVIVADLNINTLRGDLQTVIRNEGIQSYAHFPIVVDGKVVAIFNVAYTRPNALHEDSIRLFTALANRASLAIANMELFEQTKDLAVMEERNRLARDLHDSAKQKAFAALAQLGTANGIIRTKPEEVIPHLNEAETLVYEVIQELTFLIQEIYPIALQEKGLPTTLREYVFEWENRNDAVVNLTVQNERPLPLEVEQAVYRFIQEALANVSRHSKAGRVDISVVYNPESLQVIVADDGHGFDMNQKAKGMGFRSMRERISSIRGTVQIQSAPGQGTRLIAQLPIKG